MKRSVLPQFQTSPLPSSAQKVHAVAAESINMMLPPHQRLQHVQTHQQDDLEEDEPATQVD